MLQIQNKEEFDKLIAHAELSVVDFYADWCGPCLAVAPVFTKLSEKPEFASVHFAKLNIDLESAKSVAEKYKIRSIPTFIAFQAGQEISRSHSIPEVEIILKKHSSK